MRPLFTVALCSGCLFALLLGCSERPKQPDPPLPVKIPSELPTTYNTDSDGSTLIIGCSLQPDNPIYQVLEQTMQAVMAELGYQLEFRHLPHSRSIAELEQGRIDGDCARTEAFTHGSNLAFFPINPPITKQHLYAYQLTPFAHAHDHSISRLLSGKRVTYTRGTLIFKKLMDSQELDTTLIATTNYNQALKMVVAGRADIYVGFKTPSDGELMVMGMKNRFYSVAMGKATDVNIILHNRLAPLKPAIEDSFKRYIEEQLGRSTLFPAQSPAQQEK